MPNWCDNKLEIRGDESAVCQWIERSASFRSPDGVVQPLLFEAFVAPPPSVRADGSEMCDWCVNHWGTKWEPNFFDLQRSKGKAVFYFETAWAPPVYWLEEVAEQYPELRFEMIYSEGGMDFSGRLVAEDGQIKENEEGEYGDFSV